MNSWSGSRFANHAASCGKPRFAPGQSGRHSIPSEFFARIEQNAGAGAQRHSRELFHFSGGRTHRCGLPRLGINSDQRDAAYTFAADGYDVAASPEISLHIFGQAFGHR